MAGKITKIPATINMYTQTQLNTPTNRRVAAYARVSTDHEEQLTSYVAQVEYYTKQINEKPDWEFVGVYSDEGISATSTKNREGFKRMIRDALDGKIDLILTKSVSRFARNTVDTLTTIRALKKNNVEIYFEKENIFTFDGKGELLITLMSSIAQEESRSLSLNTSWGRRKRMADGVVHLPYGRFLGYEKGHDDLPSIIEKEAELVRLIYALFLDGKTAHGIAKHLMAAGIPAPGGNKRWHLGTIRSILTNEKYKGDSRLQKGFTVDFLTKKRKVNEGELPQYYVENSHPAIVSAEVFEMVQAEIERRKNLSTRHSGTSIFSSRIICGECGANYGAKVWHSNDKFRKTVWHCNAKFLHKKYCTSPTLEENTLKKAFIETFNALIENRQAYIAAIKAAVLKVTDDSALILESEKKGEEAALLKAGIEQLIATNARQVMDQKEYERRYKDLAERHNRLQTQRQELDRKVIELKARRNQIELYLKQFEDHKDLITAFDDRLWCTMVDRVVVTSPLTLRFIFRDGSERTWRRDT